VIAAATVYAYGPGYAPLGIERNFNCLYLYFARNGALRAKMVPVPRLDEYVHACLTAVNPEGATGTDLAVVRSMADFGPGLKPAGSYPSVARWDFDTSTGKHFIGIRCLDAWCEIGDPTGTFNPPHSYTVAAAAPLGEKRVVQIKGWYDEQILAAPNDQDENRLRPSGLRGTVIPAPDLDMYQDQASLSPNTADGEPWHLVAYVALRDLANDPEAQAHYMLGMGFEVAPMGPLQGLNQMYYCYGTKEDCGVADSPCDNFLQSFFTIKRLFVKILAPSGATTIRCITRRGHPPDPKVVATARWRWFIGDDTIWTACVQGCCQTDPGW